MLQTELNRRRIMAVSGDSYKAVDLGLPSGKKWANMNIGATKPEESGLYFSWGNIEGHTADSDYSYDSATYGRTSASSISSDLTLEQDAAHIIMGDSWYIPSKVDIKELIDNTDFEWVSDFKGTGIAGGKYVKKTNSSIYIFIPASGYGENGKIISKGTASICWSSTIETDYQGQAGCLDVSSRWNLVNRNLRYKGLTIRAIQD